MTRDWAEFEPEELGDHVGSIVADMVRQHRETGIDERGRELRLTLEDIRRRLAELERRLEAIL